MLYDQEDEHRNDAANYFIFGNSRGLIKNLMERQEFVQDAVYNATNQMEPLVNEIYAYFYRNA